MGIMPEIVEWDIKNWSRAIELWEKDVPKNLEGKRVLDIGGGNGGLSLFWALKGADVVCSDINPDRFDRARKLHERNKVSQKISYEVIDATQMSFQGQFDIITFKSVLGGVGCDGHYERQELMMENIYNALMPEGILYFAENLSATPVHQWARRRFVKYGKSWRYLSVEEVKKLTDKFESVECWYGGILGCFGRNKVLSSLFGSIDCVFDSFFQPATKYIVSGICKK